MNVFKRLFKIGEAEAHSLVNKLEDPIKLTEQGIRDMKVDLDKALKALAEVKAMAIRAKRDIEKYQSQGKDYQSKAMMLIKKAESGAISAEEADRLATSALEKKQEADEQLERSRKDEAQFGKSVSQLDGNIKKIRGNVSTWENELKTLKARAKVSDATKNINKQLSQIDSSGTVSMLERMKEKVATDEALAESYGEIADESKSLDEEIDKALEDTNSGSDALAALKAKMSAGK